MAQRTKRGWHTARRCSVANEFQEVARKWAIAHHNSDDDQAMQFAIWYAIHYPEGDKALPDAFNYWEDYVNV